jgi:hypothetical protein
MSIKHLFATIPTALLLAVHLNTARASSADAGSILVKTYALMASAVIVDELFGSTGPVLEVPKAITTAYIAELLMQGHSDPWLNLTYVLENRTDSTQYFSLNLALFTQDTAGPTYKDAFMDLTLTDSNDDGSASLTSVFGSFQAADERGGDTTPIQSIAFSSPYTDYFSAGTYSVFDVAGPATGPDSSTIEGGSAGFNELRFLASGYLSAGDAIVLNAFACYANDFANCPERYVISPSAVPLPAATWLFGSGLLWLFGIARKKAA